MKFINIDKCYKRNSFKIRKYKEKKQFKGNMGQLKFNFMNLTLIDKEQRNWSKRKVIIEFMLKKSSVFETLDETVI